MTTNVKLVWATPKGDELIAYMARVSNPANQNNPDSVGLINYLMKHKHWSPMEMVNVCMEIHTTRDIGRQILRHRSFSFQEFSQRYADVNALDTPFTYRECRMQDVKNRQNSLESTDNELRSMWIAQQQKTLRAARESYEWALSNGIAKEQARALLPEGLTMSKMYMNGSLRSWLHFTGVRSDKSTQKEHREVADQAIEVLSKEFPVTMKAAKEYVYTS